MYLSKLTLNPLHPEARHDLGDAYEMHRTLARAYAPSAHPSLPRFLWRLEPGVNISSSATLLVQSDVSATWSVLDTMPGYAAEVLGNKPVDLERLIEAGAGYRFRLLANPTVTRNGKRYGLTKEEEQFAWLSRQGEKHGFAVTAGQRLRNERIQMHQGRTGNRITVHSVLFEGLLRATDPARMRQAVSAGLGHGKALGLGMLSLART
jgi:CRISPR system Cascade subunit CasE